MRGLWIGVLLLVLGGCVTQPVEMGYTRIAPLVAYDRDGLMALDGAISDAQRAPKYPVDLNQYSYFTDYKYGKSWLSRPMQRVLVVGYPDRCGIPNARWGGSRAQGLTYRALDDCFNRMKKFSKETGLTCGCRVVALNDRLFVQPDELKSREHLPVIAVVKDANGMREIPATAVHKYIASDKKEITAYTTKGQAICTGTYDVSENEFRANMDMSCFDGKFKGKAVYNTGGAVDGRAYGTALMKSKGTEFLIVYGLTQDVFNKHRSEILKR